MGCCHCCCCFRCVCWSDEECPDMPRMWICLQHVWPISWSLVAYTEGNMVPTGFSDMMFLTCEPFCDMTPLIRWQEGHAACKNILFRHLPISQRFLFGRPLVENLAWPGMTPEKSVGKVKRSVMFLACACGLLSVLFARWWILTHLCVLQLRSSRCVVVKAMDWPRF